MHAAYLEQHNDLDVSALRRVFLKRAGAAALLGGFVAPAPAAEGPARGFRGTGAMDVTTGEDWIDTFFTGGAEAIVHYYADDFVFEDVTLFQTINNKDDLYRAFLPFNNAGPDSPAGIHQFDIVRYDGGRASTHRGVTRGGIPENYTAEVWGSLTTDILQGADLEYDEWAVMNWIWKATHNADFLGLPAKGKTTHTRGITFHCYRERKVVREFTFWNYRNVAIQLGAAEPQMKFWLKQPGN